MEEMLSGAFNKFDQWQARRMSRKTWKMLRTSASFHSEA